MKEVSIIIPIYNVERYVAECLNSVISQTYDHSKIECIIVDDCTPDRSMDIINNMIGQYKGEMTFIIKRHYTNKGLSASRNTGLKNATAEFVYFIDSDDYIYPNSLECLMKSKSRYPDADFVIGNWIDEKNGSRNYMIDSQKVIHNMNLLFWGCMRKITAWNYLIRKSLLAKNDILFIEGIYFEDNLFGFHLFPYGKKAIIISDVTYYYRNNQYGIMLNDRYKKVDKVIHDYLLILRYFIKELNGKAYFGKSIATISLSLNLIDYVSHHKSLINNYNEFKNAFHDIRKKFTILQLKNIRITLFLLSFLLYKPLNRIVQYKWFRCNYEKIVNIITFPEPCRW